MTRKFTVERRLEDSAHTHHSSNCRWYLPRDVDTGGAPVWREIRQGDGSAGSDQPAKQAAPLPADPDDVLFSDADMARLAARAACAGHVQAHAELAAENERELGECVDQLTSAVAHFRQALLSRKRGAQAQLGTILHTVLGHLAIGGESSALERQAELFAGNCLSRLSGVDEIEFRVSTGLCAKLSARLDQVREALGEDIKLSVEGVDELLPGQVRARWRDGWAELDPSKLEQVVLAELETLIGTASASELATPIEWGDDSPPDRQDTIVEEPNG